MIALLFLTPTGGTAHPIFGRLATSKPVPPVTSPPKIADGSGGKTFDRHLAFVLQVLGEVHGRHATFAKVAFDLVAVGEGG